MVKVLIPINPVAYSQQMMIVRRRTRVLKMRPRCYVAVALRTTMIVVGERRLTSMDPSVLLLALWLFDAKPLVGQLTCPEADRIDFQGQPCQRDSMGLEVMIHVVVDIAVVDLGVLIRCSYCCYCCRQVFALLLSSFFLRRKTEN